MASTSSSYQIADGIKSPASSAQHDDALVLVDRTETDDSNTDDVPHHEDVPTTKRLSPIDATIHLVKGNLGPGCLNLPHAFALSGWALGSGLFVLIALQGIYSMCLLVYCKSLMETSSRHHTITFMDVARASLGSTGAHLVELFLFVLQGGVCCVFTSLIRTNLRAFFPWLSDLASIVVVSLGLMLMVLLRFLKDLLWLSATANFIMIISILTATIAGLIQFSTASAPADIVVANPSPSVIVTFASDMFFAFEGIGLVLPVENSYFSQQQRPFANILVGSMSIVALLFILIGVSASLGFPNVHSGSITAYLEKQYPNVIWFSIVNALVIVAVALTFPLQLTPAMEVLDEWLDRCDCRNNRHGQLQADDASSIEVTRYTVAQQQADTEDESFREDESSVVSSSLDRTVCCNLKVWILRRWLMVFGCAVIVYFVDNLGLLIMAVGAVGQTGLAGMPCAIHLAMQYQRTAPRKRLYMLIDVIVLVICAIVMVSGLITSVSEIIGA